MRSLFEQIDFDVFMDLLDETESISLSGSWILDVTTEKTLWSKGVYTIYGLPYGTETDQSQGLAAYTEASQETLLASLEKVIAESSAFYLDLDLNALDGKRKRVRVGAKANQDAETGQVTRVYGTIQDITSEYEAQQQLGFASRILANIEDAVIAFDTEGRVTYWNRTAENLFGPKAEEAMGQSIDTLNLPFDQKHMLPTDPEGSSSHSWETSWQANSESDIRWFQVSITPMEATDGRTNGCITITKDISDSKELHEEIHQQQVYLRALYDTTPQTVLLLDSSLHLVLFNRVARQGFESQNITLNQGMHIDEIRGVELEPFRKDLTRALHGEELSYERQVDFEGGQQFWFRFDYRPMNLQKTDGTRKPYVAFSALDITSIKRSELRLRASEEKFRKLFESNVLGMVIYDLQGRPLDLNNAFIKMLGYTREELFTMHFKEFTHPEDIDPDLALAGRMVRGELDSYQLEKRYITQSGKTIWVLLTASLTKDDTGAPRSVIGVIRDITGEREDQQRIRELNEAIQHSEQRLRVILERGRDVIFLHNEAGVILDTSSSVKHITGYDPEEVINRTVTEFLEHEDPYEAKQAWNELLESPGRSITQEGLFRCKDGHTVWVESNLTNLLEEPSVQAVVSNFRDVTYRKEAMDELQNAKAMAEEMSRLKSSFLANMSHEIRTPLNGIIGTAQLLELEAQEANTRELIRLQRESAERLLSTLSSILTISKLEGEQGDLKLERIDLYSVCCPICESYTGRAAEKSIDLQCHIDPDQFYILADHAVLNNVITNLVDNAFKYTQKGAIQVRAFNEPKHVRIDIEDTGIGIATENQHHVFEAFRQESQGHDRSYEGTGLGLSIVKKYIELLEGKISLTSEKGVGSTFTVWLKHAP